MTRVRLALYALIKRVLFATEMPGFVGVEKMSRGAPESTSRKRQPSRRSHP